MPAALASQCVEATMPTSPSSSGRVVKGVLIPSASRPARPAAPPGLHDRGSSATDRGRRIGRIGPMIMRGGTPGRPQWAGRPDNVRTVLNPDRTDVRLLQALVREPRLTVSELAERAGVARNTAQARLDRLHAAGVLGDNE